MKMQKVRLHGLDNEKLTQRYEPQNKSTKPLHSKSNDYPRALGNEVDNQVVEKVEFEDIRD